ncbi:heparinase II/III family protein [Cobetia sp. 1CM21F]|uniref:heparinase II/III domain-containing protein n=1 Tax=Cobetia sp. 1CM21F TaxID=2929163 RepID=UPI0020C0A630|nr:heparinase II/III family protein [Cobetia sp. 1CM21F]MCK8067055.1 heparinase II/III family protein [Cobetia sp. 1CM21F]
MLRRQCEADSSLGRSLKVLEQQVAASIARGVVVPGQGEAGSFEHNTHKENARLIEGAALLGRLNDDEAALAHARELLESYAAYYREMPFQVARNTNPPGKLFHQILNEHIWLLHASLGLALLKPSLSDSQYRALLEGLFLPMLEMFTETYRHDFDRIHNHGLWAVAAVGICAMVLESPEHLVISIDGLDGSGETGGFLAQIALLFSPQGYYVEGPYYHRFAIHPLCLFAEAIERQQPERNIFAHADGRIGKSLHVLLSTAYPDGRFPALNDASRSMNIDDEGARCAMALLAARYEPAPELLTLAHQQQGSWLHANGVALKQAMQQVDADVQATSQRFSDGPEGNSGAHAHLKHGCGVQAQHVVLTAGQHGMGHGHFDQLGMTYFARGKEVLEEYGFARWVNVETQFGGRYLKENEGYAKQSVAHNLVVVDMQSQHGADHGLADAHHAELELLAGSDAAACARCDNAYEGVGMQRKLVLLASRHTQTPLLVDIFSLTSAEPHVYDYTFNHGGQVVRWWETESSPQPVSTALTTLEVLGDSAGYQHLWKVAQRPADTAHCMTWLAGDSFHSWHQITQAPAEAYQLRVGANDPDHNLRPDAKVMTRLTATSQTFYSLFESHGHFDESLEQCSGARPQVLNLRALEACEGAVAGIEALEITLRTGQLLLVLAEAEAVPPGGNITLGDHECRIHAGVNLIDF